MGVVGVDLVARLGEFALKTLESTAALKDQAAQFGITTGELQEYRAIAGQVGMSTEDMDSAFGALRKNLDDLALGRVGPFTKLLDRLGVSAKDAAGNIRPTGAVFSDLIDKLGSVGNEAQRNGALMIAFGEAGSKMGEMVKTGRGGVDALREAMRQTGMVLSDEQIQKADQTAKKLDMVGQVLKVKFASIVVENADAISTLADAFGVLVSVGMQRIVSAIGSFIQRMQELRAELALLRGDMADITNQYNLPRLLGKDIYGKTYDDYQRMGTGKAVRGYNVPGQSVTVDLPAATAPKPSPRPNINLGGILAPKGPKGPKGPKAPENEFEREELREQREHLELLKDRTGNLEEQNAIEKQLIDIKMQERFHQLDDMVKRKTLTAAQAKQLKGEEQINADLEKEAADHKTRIEQIERANAYANEVEQLTQDGLGIARQLARTDEERKTVDLAILDSKQLQARYELEKEIALAKEAKDEARVAQLTEEMALLRANQVQELKEFGIEHLNPMQKFENDLPRTQQEFSDKIQSAAFDQFNDHLQKAAQMASDVGDAFGTLADDILHGKNPMDILRDFIGKLAETFQKNVIIDPITEWATRTIGAPLAKQAFGSQLDKLAQQAGGTALTTQQMNTAMALATGNLRLLMAAAQSAATALSAISATGAITGGGGGLAPGLLSFLKIGAGAFAGGPGLAGGFNAASALDFSNSFGAISGFTGSFGFASGGFTGTGADTEPAGIVHKNEYVFDADTTRRFGPVLSLLSSGRIPGFNPGNAGVLGFRNSVPALHVNFGSMVFPNVRTAREARQSASQATGVIHRKLTKVVKKGMSTQ
jgi:hypothetical protein